MTNPGYRYFFRDGTEATLEEVEHMLTKEGFEEHRRVAYDKIGPVSISTVFLVKDFFFKADNTPLLFETVIFGGERNGDHFHYATEEEALEKHEELCKEAQLVERDRIRWV